MHVASVNVGVFVTQEDGDLHRQEHVASFLAVVIEGYTEASIKQTGIKTHVPRFGCFPSDVLNGILHLCRRRYGYGRCAVKQQGRTKPDGRLIGVIAAYTFVTQLTIRGAQLEMVHPTHVVFKEILFRNNPTGRHRREGCPAIILMETRRAIVTYVGFEQVTVGVGIVYACESRTIRVFEGISAVVSAISRREIKIREAGELELIATCPQVFVAHIIVFETCHCCEAVQSEVVRVVGQSLCGDVVVGVSRLG